MKFNWGHGITLFLLVFVGITVSVVVKISTDPELSHELVSENYYQEELDYQKEINKANNAVKLSESVKYRTSKQGLLLSFPNDFEYNKIEGVVKLNRPSKKILDFEVKVKLDTNYQMLIPIDKVIPGKWNMVIDWNVGEEEFMYKAKIRL